MQILIFLMVLCCSSFAAYFVDPNEIAPIITTPLGRLQGKLGQSRSGRWYYNFLSIPYAKANRFQVNLIDFKELLGSFIKYVTPKSAFFGDTSVTQTSKPAIPTVPWEGILNATIDGPICPQRNPFNPSEFTGSEDCLSLNVWVPHEDRCGDDKLPVLVNIHGGGLSGSVTMMGVFDSQYLLDECIVLFAMNYRFGALGFLTTEDGIIPGNLGLKDQVVALTWIQQYIKYFRGNSDSVTIMGMSYGGMSVSHLIVSPLAAGLFHRGILQSGNVLMPIALNRDIGGVARRVGEGLNCSMESTATLKLCLEQADVFDILNWQCRQPWCVFRDFAMPVIEFNPNDSSPPFLAEHPAVILRRGDFNKVPIIAGFSENEGMGYVLPWVLQSSEIIDELNSNWETLAPAILLYNHLNIPQEKMNEISRKIKEFYFDGQPIGKQTLNRFSDLYSDRFFVQGLFELVELHAKFATAYPYVITYNGGDNGVSAFGYDLPLSGHGHEAQFLFQLTGTSGWIVGTEQREFSERLVKMWVNFAVTGEAYGNLGATWNSTVGRANSYWHQLDVPSGNFEYYLEDRRRFWENLGLYEYEFN